MRLSGQRLKELYATQIGQDIIETVLGAGGSAAYQAIFTDMTPEEIAIATGIGMGAAVVGRPAGGALGHAVGKQLGKHKGANRLSEQYMNWVKENLPEAGKELWAAKFKPVENRAVADQLLSVYGRSRGDNIAQALVAIAAPGLIPGTENEEDQVQ